jgi:hypothetical protein
VRRFKDFNPKSTLNATPCFILKDTGYIEKFFPFHQSSLFKNCFRSSSVGEPDLSLSSLSLRIGCIISGLADSFSADSRPMAVSSNSVTFVGCGCLSG